MNEPVQPYEDRSLRVSLFLNTEAEPVPPYAALEVLGYDQDNNRIRVRRPTRYGLTSVVFNGPAPVGPNEEGICSPGPLIQVAWEDDGGSPNHAGENAETLPQPGDTLGTADGSWFLSPRYKGFKVLAALGAAGDKTALVRPMDYALVDFVRVTECRTEGDVADGVPDGYSGGVLCFFDPFTGQFEEPADPVPVWYRDLSGVEVGPNRSTGDGYCRALAAYTGDGYGRPVYVGEARDCDTCASATTTTTASPCTGSCDWEYDFGIKQWEKVASDCGTGCACSAPSYCPPDIGTAACTTTFCVRAEADMNPPNCTGTTTTPSGGTCPTTTASGCGGSREWYCHPSRGWVTKSDPCPASCPAPPPATPCNSANFCDTVLTPCVTPWPYCNGGCRWVWLTDPLGWELLSYGCASLGVPTCSCDPPGLDGTECGQEVTTPCFSRDSGTADCWDVTTTTTGPGCGGACLWGTSDGTDWDVILRNCPGCDCSLPLGAPSSACDQTSSACVPNPTTTTTAGPTTTTTTSGPCYDCQFRCDCAECGPFESGTYTKIKDCPGGGCACPGEPSTDLPEPNFCWSCQACDGHRFITCAPSPEWFVLNVPGQCCNAAFVVGGPFPCGGGACGSCPGVTAPCPSFGCLGKDDGKIVSVMCEGAVVGSTTTTSTTTTTTAGPTTTTTTTMGSPPTCGTCTFVCSGGLWMETSNDCIFPPCLCSLPGGACTESEVMITNCA